MLSQIIFHLFLENIRILKTDLGNAVNDSMYDRFISFLNLILNVSFWWHKNISWTGDLNCVLLWLLLCIYDFLFVHLFGIICVKCVYVLVGIIKRLLIKSHCALTSKYQSLHAKRKYRTATFGCRLFTVAHQIVVDQCTK